MSIRPPRKPAAPTPSTRPSAPPASPAAPNVVKTPQVPDAFEPAANRNAIRPQAPVRIGEREPAGPRPLRVVVTGYGDFAGIYNEADGRPNPSGVLARQLAELGLENATIEFRYLEVTHGAVDAFMKEMAENPPDVILSMGVSSHAQVEERPQNWKGDAVDGQGQAITQGPIDDANPAMARIPTDLPVEAIEAALRQAAEDGSIQRTVATDDKSLTGAEEDYFPDDSAYLCNYINYRLTEAFGEDHRVTAGFVHVTQQTTAAELQVIAQAVVDQVQARREAAVGPS